MYVSSVWSGFCSIYCVSYWSTFSDLACGVSCSCVTSPINHKMGEDAQLLLCGLEEVSDVGGGLWCWSDQNTAIVMVMMMILRWYGLVGFEQETWYEEKERANGDVRKEDDMNDAKKRGRVLGEVGLLMLRRLAGQGFPSHSFQTWCWSLYIEFIWRRDYDAIGKSVVVYNCSKDHPDKESFGFPCMWYPCIGYVGLSDMQPLEKALET